MLCRAAFHLTGRRGRVRRWLGQRGNGWLIGRYGKTPEELAEAVRAALRQGPHLLGADPDDLCPRRPGVVERGAVAAVRAGLFSAVVVSLPAPARRQLRPAGAHRHRPGGLPPPAAVEPARARWLRALSRKKSLRVLETIQPSSGGFLEATPLTSFVTLSLASIGRAEHPVARQGRRVPRQRRCGRRQLADRHATWRRG